MDIMYEVIYAIDSILTIILKVMGLIAIHVWIVFKKGGVE
jgi:hypothetical protein